MSTDNLTNVLWYSPTQGVELVFVLVGGGPCCSDEKILKYHPWLL